MTLSAFKATCIKWEILLDKKKILLFLLQSEFISFPIWLVKEDRILIGNLLEAIVIR